MNRPFYSRNRYVYLLLVIATVFAGLGSRRFSESLPFWIAKYAGDALWALMVYWIFGFMLRSRPARQVALYALLFSFAIEISQIYHAPWIDFVRETKFGGLIFGFGFLWSDLVCYTAGILVGAVCETAVFRLIRK